MKDFCKIFRDKDGNQILVRITTCDSGDGYHLEFIKRSGDGFETVGTHLDTLEEALLALDGITETKARAVHSEFFTEFINIIADENGEDEIQ